MQELIKVTENDNGQQVVSARDLYSFLEVSTEYSHWIKRMLEYGFEDSKDFTSFLTESTGGRPSTDYALTLDCAKEISMIQRTEKGKQARQYFLECERKAKDKIPALPSTKDLAYMVIKAEEEKEQAQKALAEAKTQLQVDAPKVLFANSVCESKDSVLVKELAGYITQNGYAIGQNRLFEWLRSNGFLCAKGEYYNLPTQRATEMGLFEVKKTAINKPDGTVLTSNTTKVTGKGMVYFLNKFLTIGRELAVA